MNENWNRKLEYNKREICCRLGYVLVNSCSGRVICGLKLNAWFRKFAREILDKIESTLKEWKDPILLSNVVYSSPPKCHWCSKWSSIIRFKITVVNRVQFYIKGFSEFKRSYRLSQLLILMKFQKLSNLTELIVFEINLRKV